MFQVYYQVVALLKCELHFMSGNKGLDVAVMTDFRKSC
jgi:hypothetical protein